MADIWILLVAAGIMGVYSLLAMRLSKIIQPLRLKFVQRVNWLVGLPNVDRQAKINLSAMTDRLFDKRFAWGVVITYPVGVFHALKGKRATADDTAIDREVSLTGFLGILCIMGNSPLAMALFALELVLLALFFVPLGAAMRATMRILLAPGGQENSAGTKHC